VFELRSDWTPLSSSSDGIPLKGDRIDCTNHLVRTEPAHRLRSWKNVVLLGCNRGIQHRDRGPCFLDSANPGLWRPSGNCNGRRLLDRQPSGLSGRCLSSTERIISEASRQGNQASVAITKLPANHSRNERPYPGSPERASERAPVLRSLHRDGRQLGIINPTKNLPISPGCLTLLSSSR
jgi:hypothetical protein